MYKVVYHIDIAKLARSTASRIMFVHCFFPQMLLHVMCSALTLTLRSLRPNGPQCYLFVVGA